MAEQRKGRDFQKELGSLPPEQSDLLTYLLLVSPISGGSLEQILAMATIKIPRDQAEQALQCLVDRVFVVKGRVINHKLHGERFVLDKRGTQYRLAGWVDTDFLRRKAGLPPS